MRWDVINAIISLKKAQTYLEIGLAEGETFFKINAPVRYGVDPDTTAFMEQNRKHFVKNATVSTMESDRFFDIAKDARLRFDVVFIDGLHEVEQVELDMENALLLLNPGGVIVLHDTCPPDSRFVTKTPTHKAKSGRYLWCGSVWKIFPYLWRRENLVFWTVNSDYGCTVITLGEIEERKNHIDTDYSFDEFDLRKSNIARVFSLEEILDELRDRYI